MQLLAQTLRPTISCGGPAHGFNAYAEFDAAMVSDPEANAVDAVEASTGALKTHSSPECGPAMTAAAAAVASQTTNAGEGAIYAAAISHNLDCLSCINTRQLITHLPHDWSRCYASECCGVASNRRQPRARVMQGGKCVCSA